MFEDGSINRFPKKEIIKKQKDLEKLEKNLGGIKNMEDIPGVAFIIDPKNEEIAVKECIKLGIPTVAIVDTNCDPDVVDYVIPGNDDAIRAIKLFVASIADACLQGLAKSEERESLEEQEEQTSPEETEKEEE